jgi:hypothetical protein
LIHYSSQKPIELGYGPNISFLKKVNMVKIIYDYSDKEKDAK